MTDVAQFSFGIVKWIGYVVVVYWIARESWTASGVLMLRPALRAAQVVGAATVRTGLGLARGWLLLQELDFQARVGPSPWAIVALVVASRFVEWAAVFATFFPRLRTPGVLVRAAWRSTGVSFLLDAPAAILTLILGFSTGAIHVC